MRPDNHFLEEWSLWSHHHRLGGPSHGQPEDPAYSILGEQVSKEQHDAMVAMLDRWTLPFPRQNQYPGPEARRLWVMWKLVTMYNRSKMRKLLRSKTARILIEESWRPEGPKAKRHKADVEDFSLSILAPASGLQETSNTL
jgi:hypothetical protein